MKKILDPFRYFSGSATLSVGAAILFATAWAARMLGGTFRGVVSQGLGCLGFGQLLLQQIAGWAVFTTLLYAAARVLASGKVRARDMYGHQLLARLPLTLILLGGALPVIRGAMDLAGILPPEEMLARIDMRALMIYGFAALGMLAWFFAWSYRGFVAASRLAGWKAVTAYILCYLLAEGVASWCTEAIAAW